MPFLNNPLIPHVGNRRNNYIRWVCALSPMLAAPLFLFPSMDKAWVFAMVPFFWIILASINGYYLEKTLINLPILILLVQVFVSSLISPNVIASLPKIAGVYFGISCYFSLAFILNCKKLIVSAAVVFITSGMFLAAIGLLGMFTFRSKSLGVLEKIKDNIPLVNFNLPGAEEGFQPNAVGGTLLLFIPLVLALAYWKISGQHKRPGLNNPIMHLVGLFLVLIFMLAVFILTQSRGSWLAFVSSTIIILLLSWRDRSTRQRTIILFITIISILSILFILLKTQGDRSLVLPEVVGNLSGRGIVWSIGIKTILSHPLTGIGLNQVRFLPEVGYGTAHVHNHLLHTGAELGLPGLIAYMAILFGIAFMVHSTKKQKTSGVLRIIVLGLGWGQLAYFIFGLNDSIPLGAKPSIFFWLSTAMIAATYNLIRNTT